MSLPMPDDQTIQTLRRGVVIPAHPLALDASRKLDERHQRALTRYYLAAGAGGVAVGVHTTQFAIREAGVGLLEPVLALAAEEVQRHAARADRAVVRIAGICGTTGQAVAEAELARRLGYDIGLLSLSALRDAPVSALIDHARVVAGVIPIMGFYLQPAVGGRALPLTFWRELAAIENLVGIKIAPFNRYQTLDVLRGVAESGRGSDIALYTGNDDNIIADLLTPFRIPVGDGMIPLRIAGGLLGHWAVWTRRAVEQLEAVRAMMGFGMAVPNAWLTLAAEVTDSNAAFFDAANNFAGCIAGIHEVLRRQGLMATRHCLDPDEDLSPGQLEEIVRVCAAYPHLSDDEFVATHLDEWLR
jgi:hypothetical protein